MKRMMFLLSIVILLSACSTTRYAAYRVITEPESAHVTFVSDGEYMGISPTKTWWSWNDTGNPMRYLIRVEKTGYDTVERAFTVYPKYATVEEAKEDVKDIFVHLHPYGAGSEIKRSIRITSDPSGAAVYSNQDYIGSTPFDVDATFSEASSQFELRFEKSGYGTERRMLTILDDRIHVVLHRSY